MAQVRQESPVADPGPRDIAGTLVRPERDDVAKLLEPKRREGR